MPAGLHLVVAERSSGSNPRVSPTLVASTRTIRRMPRGTTSCHDGPPQRAVSRIPRRRNQHMLANAGGTTSRLKGRFDSGRSRLAQAARTVVYLDRTQAPHVSPTPGRQHQNEAGECWRDYRSERLPSKQEVGGSTPPPGNRVAQKNCLADLVAGTEYAAVANAARDYIRSRGHRFDSGRALCP